MGVVTRYRVACQIRVLKGTYLKREKKQCGLRPLPGSRLYMHKAGADVVVHHRYWRVMKVVARCLKHGGSVDYATEAPTPAELERGWHSAAVIALHWTEKGLNYGKRKVSRYKPDGPKLGQGFAGQFDHQGLSGSGVCHDPAPDLLSDGRAGADRKQGH